MFLGKSHSDLTDEELLDRYRRKADEQLLGELFVRYSQLMYGVCLKYLSDRELAKDAVMQIFEALPGKIANHQIERFRGWIYVTTRNHCLMQLRTEKGTRFEELQPSIMELSLTLNPGDEEPLENNLGKLKGCIEKLASEQKDCVKLFFLDELSYKEIVDKTGHEYKKVKSFIQNGKRNLKICMEQNG